MIQLLNVNPFAEAMFYYVGRANDMRFGKKLAKAIKLHPEYKDTLEKMLLPVVELEQKLDSELSADDALVSKYFKKLDNLNPDSPFGFCLASVMAFYPVMNHIDYSINEMCKYLRECSLKERMYSLCFGLIDKSELLYHDKNGIEEFSTRLENMPLPLEDKWKILNAAFNYQVHIDELLSLITPAAKLIEAARNKYEDIETEFRKLYSADDVQMRLESYLEFKLDFLDVIKVAPLVFGFDTRFAAFQTDDSDVLGDNYQAGTSSVSRIFVGIARHIINSSPKKEIEKFTEKMKALSDSTRLEILFYLCNHREYGQELCARFGLQRSALSYHITKLLTAGFVTGELVGIQTYYSADKAGIRRMLDAFAEKIK